MKSLPQSDTKYQVYFFTCPAQKPFHFIRHPWVVTVSFDTTNRWEVIHRLRDNKERFGYVYKNYYSCPTQGLRTFPGSTKFRESKLIGSITGNENSLAYRMVEFIQTYSPDYIYKDNYHFYPGPNSNTYINWILKKFPESNITLPWNCFGKNF